MRRWLPRTLKLVLLLTVFAAVLIAIDRYVNRDEINALARRRFEADLGKLVLSRVELHDATLEEALAYLRAEALKAGWKGDLRFVVPGEAELARRFHGGVIFPKLDDPASNADATPPPRLYTKAPLPIQRSPITVSVVQIPLFQACMYVSSLDNHVMHLSDRSAEFVLANSGGTYDPFVKRTFRTQLFDNRKLGAKLPNGRFDVRAVLHADHSIQFYDGTSAEYDPTSRTLELVNTEDYATIVDIVCTGRDPFAPKGLDRIKAWLRTRFHPAPPVQQFPNPLPYSNPPGTAPGSQP